MNYLPLEEFYLNVFISTRSVSHELILTTLPNLKVKVAFAICFFHVLRFGGAIQFAEFLIASFSFISTAPSEFKLAIMRLLRPFRVVACILTENHLQIVQLILAVLKSVSLLNLIFTLKFDSSCTFRWSCLSMALTRANLFVPVPDFARINFSLLFQLQINAPVSFQPSYCYHLRSISPMPPN